MERVAQISARPLFVVMVLLTLLENSNATMEMTLIMTIVPMNVLQISPDAVMSLYISMNNAMMETRTPTIPARRRVPLPNAVMEYSGRNKQMIRRNVMMEMR